MQWEGKWGPASIISAAGIVITIAGVVFGVGMIRETIAESEKEVGALRTLSTAHTERLVRLETKLDMLMTTSRGKKLAIEQ